jgi:phospholipase C
VSAFDNFHTTDQFLEDAAKGALSNYSFIEPNLLHGHNDMHPAEGALFPGLALDAPSSLLGGEALLAKLYDAVRSASSSTGSNAFNTLFMVNFDEHGGTYDHVPPPPAPPPDPAATAGQCDFRFDRCGVRIPAIAISPWIAERTVVNDEYRNTSVIRTLRERWSLGAPFSAREATARDIAPILSLDHPRHPDHWPDVDPEPVPAFDTALIPPDAPLSPLAKALLHALLALGKQLGQSVPDISPDATSRAPRASPSCATSSPTCSPTSATPTRRRKRQQAADARAGPTAPGAPSTAADDHERRADRRSRHRHGRGSYVEPT